MRATLSDARKNVTRRVHWLGDTHMGTIVGAELENGYVRYIIDWDPGQPAWWATRISMNSATLVIDADNPAHMDVG